MLACGWSMGWYRFIYWCVRLLERDSPVNGNKKLVLLSQQVVTGSQLMGLV